MLCYLITTSKSLYTLLQSWDTPSLLHKVMDASVKTQT